MSSTVAQRGRNTPPMIMPFAGPIGRLSSHRAALPLAIFLAALALRLVDLGRRPFWLDEIFTLQRASLPLTALVQDSFLNHHMPSFFLLLSPLTALGHPQFWLRLPSAAFGALAVMMVYLIAKQIAGRAAGIFAAFIMGLSPTSLAFSQEARSYTMEMCLILLALYGVAILASDVTAASRKLRGTGGCTGAWVAFTLGSAAALDVLGDGLPWVITANLIFLVVLFQSPNRKQFLKNFLLADLTILALTLPFYIVMLSTQDKGFVDSVMWIPPLNPARLWYDFSSIYLMRVADSVSFRLMDVPTPMAIIWAIEAGLLAAAGFGIWCLRSRPAQLAAIGLSFLFLPLCLTLISIWRPVLLPRYILWSAAPFAILAGIGGSFLISHLNRRAKQATYALVFLVLLANLLPYYDAETKPRWDIAARILAHDVAPGDVVYLQDKGALPILRAYLPAAVQTVVLHDSDGDLTHAKQAQSQGKRVWVVFGHAGQGQETRQEIPQLYSDIAAFGSPSQIELAGSRIYINLFDPAHPGCMPQPMQSLALPCS